MVLTVAIVKIACRALRGRRAVERVARTLAPRRCPCGSILVLRSAVQLETVDIFTVRKEAWNVASETQVLNPWHHSTVVRYVLQQPRGRRLQPVRIITRHGSSPTGSETVRAESLLTAHSLFRDVFPRNIKWAARKSTRRQLLTHSVAPK